MSGVVRDSFTKNAGYKTRMDLDLEPATSTGKSTDAIECGSVSVRHTSVSLKFVFCFPGI